MSKFSGFKNLESKISNMPEVEKTSTSPKKESKVFNPGLHDLKITEVIERSPVQSTPTWTVFSVRYEGAGGKQAFDNVCVPSSDAAFDSSREVSMLKRLQVFISAVGLPSESNSLGKSLEKLFGGDVTKSLVGKTLTARFGYNNLHLIPKDGKLVLAGPKGSIINDPNGSPRVFKDANEADAWCKTQKNMKFQRFSEILEYQVAVQVKKTGTDGWAD